MAEILVKQTSSFLGAVIAIFIVFSLPSIHFKKQKQQRNAEKHRHWFACSSHRKLHKRIFSHICFNVVHVYGEKKKIFMKRIQGKFKIDKKNFMKKIQGKFKFEKKA